jgi:RimJ/RimL family protein N-acetyltransferase
MEQAFAAELAAAAAIDRSSYRYTFVPDGADSSAAYVASLVADGQAGKTVPFAQRELSTGQLVGCTRFMELRWWSGRPEPDEVEVGGTWLRPDVQRSAVNTEAKLLMFTQAFDVWGVRRVALCTDERNERSRRAIARIGASFEGILRKHRNSWVPEEAGQPRNSAIFAITDDEWQDVRQRLTERLATRS